MIRESAKSNTGDRAIEFNRFGYHQLGWKRYSLLCIAVIAQMATLLITWQLWEVRTLPPNLPVFDFPQFPVAIFLLVSLIGVLIDPIRGFLLHLLVMILACVLDQYRLQPQFLATMVLMLAALGRRGQLVGYWFLVAMWFWAGLHKLLSPDWFAHASYWILERGGLPREDGLYWHKTFALVVAVSEIGLGLLALVRPRLAAFGCALLHLGIVLLLYWIDWNFSVIPWNLATAIVGFWILFSLPQQQASLLERFQPYPVFQTIVAVLCFVPPIGFYWSVFDHGYANVLYSDCLPRAQITSKERLQTIRGWDVVNVPFPSERRLLKQYFERVAQPGDKLHVHDPRPALGDQHFVLDTEGKACEIGARDFFAAAADQVAGVGVDDRYCKFYLRQWGEITQRYYLGNDASRHNLISFGYTFKPEYYRPKRLEYLQGLPNLEELQLEGCAVNDDDLKTIGHFVRLTGIGLNGTAVTDAGLRHLANLPRLDIVETEKTRVSPAGLQWLQERLPRLSAQE